jgi:ribosomal protein L29
MVALAFVSAGVLGLARSDLRTETARENALEATATNSVPGGLTDYPASNETAPATAFGKVQDSTIGPTTGREQRVSATLTLEVADSDAVSRAAQEALDLTRSLGGHVVSASVATGEEGTASLTVRVPVARVQDAIAGLSALGRIVSQQVTIDDLQEQLDTLERRQASLRSQIARISARLETEELDAETQALLETRLQNLRAELRSIRQGIAATSAEARMSTIQLAVVTPGAYGVAAPPASRLDRTIDEALNVLAWEGVIVLGLLIVAAPFAIAGVAVWVGRRLYRRREEERLLAA